jgi:hypothetical protein
MNQPDNRAHHHDRPDADRTGSSVATHRKAERSRTFTYHPRPEARM